MPRIEKLTETQREHLAQGFTPPFSNVPWASGPPLNQRRVVIVSTSGLHMRSDHPFMEGQRDLYRIIPGNAQANDLIMSHGEPTFDRSGFQRDYNICFPLDRLRELAAEGVNGSVADFHYSFGAPMSAEDTEMVAREIAGLLKKDNVNAALFFPV